MLDIITVIANPLLWKSRVATARKAIGSWLEEPEVRVTLVECAYGDRPYELEEFAGFPRITFVPVRAKTLVWNKENLMNIGFSRAPADARFFGSFDADIVFRRPGWAKEVINALQIYPVIQPWGLCYDLGPNDELIGVHKSFASLLHSGSPVKCEGNKFWKADGGPYEYPHSGYAWAYTRDILDRLGGLFEVGGMGSGDHHMALALAGHGDNSVHSQANGNYLTAVQRWEARAREHVKGKVGSLPFAIEHIFHGSKKARNYVGRWDMFVQHQFDPVADLIRNSWGVLEFSGDKPDLERAFDRYLRSRNEDANAV